MAGTANYETDGNIAIITLNNPPLNVLSTPTQISILEGIEKAVADDAIEGIVIMGSEKALSAGADVTEFGKVQSKETMPDRYKKIEATTKPIVAVLSGIAFGGGFELALACHYRVATKSAIVGLPEVKIGVIPGAGGTQRLPRLIGAEACIKIACGGDPVPAVKFQKDGLVDQVIEGDLKAAAVEFIRGKVNDPIKRISEFNDRIEQDKPNREAIFSAARANLKKRSRGQISPLVCLDAIEAAFDLPFDEGMAKEREGFKTCVTSPQSAALRHMFFAEREARKIPDVPKDTPVREIKSVAVLGAGTMGGGIAMNFLNVGIPVTIIEHAQEPLDRGIAIIRKNYENTAKKGRMTAEDVEKRMSLLTGTLSREDAADVDLVIEAVFENMDLKKEIFTDLDKICKPGAILASNTSTLDIDAMAAMTTRPEDFIGLHFFSPANVMPLLEIVRGAKTSKEVVATSMKLAGTIKKLPVLVGVCDGFVGNRMVAPYGNQGRQLLMEGSYPEDVDRVLQGFGFAMGLFTMGDLAGIDVGWRVRQEKGLKEPIGDALYELGRLGQKTGAGYYTYKDGDRTPHPDPIVKEIIDKASAEHQITRREISDDEILYSCLLSLVNEGAKILEEGIALRASDIDVVYCNGYGFPRYEGGPMHWADSIGLPKALELIKEYQQKYPTIATWKPAALIEELAAEGSSFAEYDKKKTSA